MYTLLATVCAAYTEGWRVAAGTGIGQGRRIDDGNASFNSLHYDDIIISLENTASEKVSLSSKNEIYKNKDRNRLINNSDYVYEDKPEKILFHNKNINCENMNEQTDDDNNLKTR